MDGGASAVTPSCARFGPREFRFLDRPKLHHSDSRGAERWLLGSSGIRTRLSPLRNTSTSRIRAVLLPTFSLHNTTGDLLTYQVHLN
jgi:hypothetical protein